MWNKHKSKQWQKLFAIVPTRTTRGKVFWLKHYWSKYNGNNQWIVCFSKEKPLA